MAQSPTEKMCVATVVEKTVGDPLCGRRLAGRLENELGTRQPDLCILFASPHYADEMDALTAGIGEYLAPRAFVGVTGETVIEAEHEHEGEPAVCLWGARLPNVGVQSFHLSRENVAAFEGPEDLRQYVGVPADEQPSFLFFVEPFSFGPALLPLLGQVAVAYPNRPALGGVASAADEPNKNQLVFEGQTLRSGLVGVALWGDIELDIVVSQGCRPIGQPLVITKAENNIIHEVGGKPTLTALTEVLRSCRPRDVELARQHGLLIGRVINEYQGKFRSGDFLIRNPIGSDQESGAMAINDLVRTGQTIQFHVRDGNSASAELSSLLKDAAERPAVGALLFTCNGRGRRLFSHASHDARALAAVCGQPPVGGFFCAGEIGPVGERNYLHGHTACVGFLRPLDA